MENIEYVYEPISNMVFILKILFISMFTFYTNLKIIDCRLNLKNTIFSIIAIIISIITMNIFVKNTNNYMIDIVILSLILGIILSINTKITIGYSIVINIISLSINYIIYFSALSISFFPSYIFNIKNDYVNFIVIVIIYAFLLNILFKIKRLKNGIIVIKNKIDNEYFDMMILNACTIIVLVVTVLSNLYDINFTLAENLISSFVVLSIIMFITIQKTLTMYYKHKMLIKDLNETKEELENMKKDRDRVEQENIEISKKSHSISHKIESLEHKLKELEMKNEIAEELDIKDRINEISKEYTKDRAVAELSKTGIEIIDDMLECMRSKCIQENIEFDLQLSGNIHHMTNNFVSKEELEILLADHIKDAIIAIQHSDNINRSILVRLGLIGEYYSLYIYDSGIEFEIDTLINLGTKPITTHADEDGTGMGFINTFDTLKKHKASMIIDEFGKPSRDNYTKVIMIKFDGKDEFRIQSYRSEEIENNKVKKDLKIEIK